MVHEVTTEELRRGWGRTVIHAIAERDPVAAGIYKHARPELVDDWLLVCHFDNDFTLKLANERPRRKAVEVTLYELIGREFSVGVSR